MKKRFVTSIMAISMAISMAACGSGAAEAPTTETSEAVENVAGAASSESTKETEIANPWRECTEEEAIAAVPNLFKAPEGATNIKWSIMNADADGKDGNWPLVQMTFDLDRLSYTAREQTTGDNFEDISGMYYDWIVEDDVTLNNWGGGNMQGKSYRYIGEDKYVDVINWYDIEIGASYSLSTEDKDLDGFDIQAIAEAMYDETKVFGYDAPEGEGDVPVLLDISGCDTFTDIVNKLEPGWAYANANIGGTDVLLVSDYSYDYDGNNQFTTIDSRIYCYNDGVPYYLGYVSAGGTAYPLTIVDGKLCICSHHYVTKYNIVDNCLMVDEEASEVFDTSGNATYSYYSRMDESKSGEVSDDSVITGMFDEYMNGDMIYYSVVQ